MFRCFPHLEITINLMLTEQFLCCVVKIILHSPCAPRIDKIENNVSLFGVKIEEEIRESIFAEPHILLYGSVSWDLNNLLFVV